MREQGTEKSGIFFVSFRILGGTHPECRKEGALGKGRESLFQGFVDV